MSQGIKKSDVEEDEQSTTTMGGSSGNAANALLELFGQVHGNKLSNFQNFKTRKVFTCT
jgi:hypothetical protein